MPTCHQCGNSHSASATFCPACGITLHPLEAAEMSDPLATQPPSDIPGQATLPPPPLSYQPLPPPFPTPPPAPGPEFRPPLPSSGPTRTQGLGIASAILLGIGALISLACAAIAAAGARNLREAREPGASAYGLAEDGFVAIIGAGVIWSIAAIPITTLLIIFTHRANRNLKAFGLHHQSIPTGLVTGSWFIPVFWLVGPYLGLRDAIKGTAADATTNPGWKSGVGSFSLVAWWALFAIAQIGWFATMIAAIAIDPFLGESRNNGSIPFSILANLDGYETVWTLTSISYVVCAISAIFGVVAIIGVNSRQNNRVRELSGHR